MSESLNLGPRRRLTSRLSLKAWELHPEPSTFATEGHYSNKDMDPTPRDQQVWTTWSYAALWISDAFNAPAYELASASVAIGLGWRQALPAIALGHILIALATVANGVIGARVHVPFPVINRSSFGFWFSYFTVISRVILAMFWFGIQTFTGSECMYQMIKAIWPSFARLPNHLPESASITSAGLVSYLLYWLLQLPFVLVSPQKVRWLFMLKAVIVPPTFIALMIWALVKAGPGPLFDQKSTLHGSAQSWAWLSALNSALGLWAPFVLNIGDFARYSRRPSDQYIQLAIVPALFTFCAFIGLVVTSASKEIYGDFYWDPLRLIDQWDNRAAAFFTAFSFTLGTIGTNISANSISAGNDFTALFPKYMNIRRGAFLCAVLGGWALCPWKILAQASGLLSFMGGLTILMSPIASIMITDYWLVRKGKIDVPSLYRPDGRYRYNHGVNWRAALALICTVPLGIPGLIGTIAPKIDVGVRALHLFDISYIMEFPLAMFIYYTTSKIWPPTESFVTESIWDDDTDGDHTPDNSSIEKDEKLTRMSS